MALTFVSSSSDRADFGSNAALDNLSAYTAIMCIYPTDTTSGRRFFNKGLDNNGTAVWWDWSTAGDIACVCNRVTDSVAIATNPLTQNIYQFLAVTYSDAAGFNVYTRPLSSGVFTEVSYTGTPVAGSGARIDDSAESLIFFNRNELDAGFGGSGSCVKFFNAKLTLDELNKQTYRAQYPSSLLLYSELGISNGTGQQVDRSSGQNHGTVTGATLAFHPPQDIWRRRRSEDDNRVVKTITENGFGSDLLNISASQSISETGSGNDGFPPLSASVNISDAGSGIDALILSSLHALSESGIGAESLNVSPLITVVDNGLGVDGLTLAISVSLSDSGIGQENISVLTSILKIIADSGKGSDLISQISAQYSISESAKGTDQTILSALLSLNENAIGLDAVNATSKIIKTILETATGSDSVSTTVSVSIAEVGNGAEVLLLNSLLVLVETGSGIDVVNNFDSSTRITTITFSLSRRIMTFDLKKRTITFDIKKRTMDFTLN